MKTQIFYFLLSIILSNGTINAQSVFNDFVESNQQKLNRPVEVSVRTQVYSDGSLREKIWDEEMFVRRASNGYLGILGKKMEVYFDEHYSVIVDGNSKLISCSKVTEREKIQSIDIPFAELLDSADVKELRTIKATENDSLISFITICSDCEFKSVEYTFDKKTSILKSVKSVSADGVVVISSILSMNALNETERVSLSRYFESWKEKIVLKPEWSSYALIE